MVPRLRPRFARARGLALLLSATGPAWAASPTERAAAEALFEDARRLLREDRAAEACPKLEESQRLDPGVGTLLHLGECYARLGRTASAWATFREAEALARASGQADREQLAKARAEALSPRLARLTIEAPAVADAPGLRVLRDGEDVGRASLGASLPVDPGTHVVDARAEGHEDFHASVAVAEGASVTVTVPRLRSRTPSPASQKATFTTPRERAVSPVTVGLAAGGALGVAAGAYFGLSARAAWSRSRERCDADNACDPEGLAEIDRATSRARVSTALFGLGALLGGAAVAVHLGGRRDVAIVAHPSGVALRGVLR